MHKRLGLWAVLCALGVAGNAFTEPHPLFSVSQEQRETAIGPEDRLDARARQLPRAAGHAVARKSARVVRRRTARIDFAHLDALREPSAAERAGLRLNLFDDAAFDLTDLDISATPRGFTLSAAIEGSVFGTATLAVSGDVVSGSVRVQRGTYTIRSVGGGRVAIRQVQPPPPDLRAPEPPLRPVGDQRKALGDRAAKEASEGEEAVVDLLVLWSRAAREEAGGRRQIETTIDHVVAVANRAYADSGAHVRFNVVHMQELDVEDDGGLNLFHALVGGTIPFLDAGDIRQTALRLRDVVGADLIHFLGSGAGCAGVAQIPNSLDDASDAIISMSKQACVINGFDQAIAHELTHNFGIHHDRYRVLREEDWSPKPRPYGHGYVNQAAFLPDAPESAAWQTVMAYDDQCSLQHNRCTWLARLSNPTQTYLGDPLGVAGDAETRTIHGPADARRAVNEVRTVVAGYRAPRANLAVTASLANQALAAGESISLQVRLRNLGRVGSDDIVLRVYRSADATASDDDHLVGTQALAPLGPVAEAPTIEVESQAPAEPGTYHYIACVADALAANPCSVLPVTVGPMISVGTVTALEGQALAFPVELSSSLATDVVVAYAVEGNTAAREVDFRAPRRGEVTIPAGATVASINVETIDDAVAEPSDTMRVVLTDVNPTAPEGAVLSVTSNVAIGNIQDDDGDLDIPDENLRHGIAAALGRAPTEAITADDMATISMLRLDSIRDLTGLQFASGLRELWINYGIGHYYSSNMDSSLDLMPIAHLPKLVSLQIWSGNISEIRPLRHLTNLRRLDLQRNRIDDIGPLSGLVDLQELVMTDNRVSDLTPLSAMTRLTRLDAERNDISTLSGLDDLMSLWWLRLDANPISDLTPIASLPLNTLTLNGTNVSDLSPIRNIDTMVLFEAASAQLRDVRALGEWSACTALLLRGNAISDVSPFARMSRLGFLDLSHNEVSDVTPLASTDLWGLELDFNPIRDISVLAELESLTWLSLEGTGIVDVGPLSSLTGLTYLDLGGNGIADVSALAGLRSLTDLQLAGNLVSDAEPLSLLARLSSLDISDNSIVDIAVLHSLPELHEVFLHGNPLAGRSLEEHLSRLRDRGVSVYRVIALAMDASAKEGEYLAATVRLTGVADGEVKMSWELLTRAEDRLSSGRHNSRGQIELDVVPTVAAADLDALDPTTIVVPAGSIEMTTSIVQPLEDRRKEPHELLVLELEGATTNLPHGVALPLRRAGWTNVRISQAVGLIVDPEGPSHDMLLFPSTGGEREAFVRVVNGGRRSAAHVEAFTEDGAAPSSATLALPSGGAVHFNSGDLQDGNWDKGLGRGIGPGQGDWRLRLWGNDMQVLSYIRTSDGFLTSMHDVVPTDADGQHRVPTFNPASNRRQESRLRLANAGGAPARIEIYGVDDAGERAGPVRLQLDGGMSRTLTARQLESGDGLEGALGDGSGKWRLVVGSDQPVFVVSLMESASGHLTNLSTVPANEERGDEETIHHVPLFLSAADASGRQGFARVVNKGAAPASMRIRAYDDRGEYATNLTVPGNGVVHFNSDDLELGNDEKGIEGVGSGSGNWRLELATDADVDVLAYVRHEDGFLTSMHDVVATSGDGEHRYAVATFNPGSNRNQVSSLLLANSAEAAATVTIAGVDDRGHSYGQVGLVVPGRRSVRLSAADLETGADGFNGRLGDGAGKWRLAVTSSAPLWVMNLLESPTGHLTNLSSVPPMPPVEAE